MNALYLCEIAGDLPLPDFGAAFCAHIAAKTHPNVRAASLSAWNLLAVMLREKGYAALPEVAFSDSGKPYFTNSPLYFSLAHSHHLAAAVLADAPCGADIEMVREDVDVRLLKRCLSENELAAGCDFFDVWTKKECIAKLEGSGLPGRPCCMDTLDEKYENRFFCRRVWDSHGNEYALAALGKGFERIEKRSIII